MKDSGIEWIGEIPEDWEVKPLKYVANHLESGGTPESNNEQYYSDNGIPWVIIADMKTETILDTQKKLTEEGLKSKKLKVFPPKTLLYAMYASVGKVAELGIHAAVNQAILAISVNSCLASVKYLKFCLNAFEKYVIAESNGNTQFNLNANKVENFYFAFPVLRVQQKLADYLDKKCAAVDRLMENQRLQIEKLKEYKQSLITEAVTKGLDKTVPLKSSGVEWIEDICKWFELRRLKEVAQILDEYRKPITADLRNQEADVLYDYYGASGVIDKIDGYTIDDHVMLIGEDGANLRMRNLPLMYEVKGKAWINNHAHILKPNADMNFYYLFYCLESLDINPYITGSAQPKLSQENLKNILLPVPPLSEQQQIAEYLDKKCAEIDGLISIKQQKIEKLTEYKKSLIYEYVTGKKQVG